MWDLQRFTVLIPETREMRDLFPGLSVMVVAISEEDQKKKKKRVRSHLFQNLAFFCRLCVNMCNFCGVQHISDLRERD